MIENVPALTAIILTSACSVSAGSSSARSNIKQCQIAVTNLACHQPVSPFFVAAHNRHGTPVFELGETAAPELASLAEDGDPSELVNPHKDDQSRGVLSATAEGGPLGFGESSTFNVRVQEGM